jgi:hypothetical protein
VLRSTFVFVSSPEIRETSTLNQVNGFGDERTIRVGKGTRWAEMSLIKEKLDLADSFAAH